MQLNKEKMRGVDYRKTLIFLTIALYQTATRDVRALLVTLFEMVEIFYTQEKKRSPRLILRLHNLCWKHSIECHKELTPTRALTSRKLFGLYFHACVSHSVFLLRLVSHRSTNAEMFERLFRSSQIFQGKHGTEELKILLQMQFSTCEQRMHTIQTLQ